MNDIVRDAFFFCTSQVCILKIQKLDIVVGEMHTTISISASNLFRYEALFFTFFACIISKNGLKLT